MQERGKAAMGVDQYTSTHHFDTLSDGGRIELQVDTPDSVGVARVRSHMREIARACNGFCITALKDFPHETNRPNSL